MNQWLDQSVSNVAAGSPLAQVRAASDLPGGWRKQINVPDDQAAVVARPGAPAQTLPPGTHTLGTIWNRFTGQLSETAYTFLPQTPFPLVVTTLHLQDEGGRFLLTGDGEMVDVQFTVLLQIEQPAQFYERLVAGRGRLTTFDLQVLLSRLAEPILQTAAREYAARDLNDPIVRKSLIAALQRQLPPRLAEYGLALKHVKDVTAKPAGDVVAMAERSEAVRARLRQIAQSGEMDKLNTQAELHEFARQLEQDYDAPGLADLVQASTQTQTAPVGRGRAEWLIGLAREMLHSWLAGAVAAGDADHPYAAGDDTNSESGWLRWLTPARFLSAISLIVMLILAAFETDATAELQIELLLMAGGLLAAVVSSVIVQERKQRQALEARARSPIAILPADNRLRADLLLRQQVTAELNGVQDKLKKARFQLVRAQETFTRRLKEMEEQVRRMGQALGQTQVGRAAYLTQAEISPRQVAAMLEYDDLLRQQVSAIGDDAQELLNNAIAGEPVADLVTTLQTKISNFDHYFRARSRFLSELVASPLPEPESQEEKEKPERQNELRTPTER